MARNFSAAFKALLAEGRIYPRLLVEMELASTWLRYWTGLGDLTYDSKTWLASSLFKGITPYHESEELQADGVQIKLSGESTSIISTILNDVRQNKDGNIYLGLTDGATTMYVETLFKGRLDKVEIDDTPDSATATFYYESRLIELDKIREWRYNHSTQQIFYPGDLGFEYVEQMEKWSGYWGNKPTKAKDKNAKKNKPKRAR